jgi:hypothetical protein
MGFLYLFMRERERERERGTKISNINGRSYPRKLFNVPYIEVKNRHTTEFHPSYKVVDSGLIQTNLVLKFISAI